MQDQEKNQLEREENVESGISLRAYFAACGHNWYWFLLSLIACTTIAFVYAQSQTKHYRSYAYIKIKSDDKKNGSNGGAGASLFADLGLGNKADAVENEIYVLKSTLLLDQVVDQLGLASQYYTKPLLRKINIYNESPITVTHLSPIPKTGVGLEIVPKSNDEFTYLCNNDENNEWKTARYGTKITFPAGLDSKKNKVNASVTVTKTQKYSPKALGEKIYVHLSDPHQKAITIFDKLDVKKADKETTVLGLNVEAENYEMAKDILNTLIEVYNADAINDKNRIARNTEAFIVERIASISKDLGIVDTEIESLKIRNNIPDIAANATQFVTDGVRYKDAVAEVEMQLQLAKYIKDYMGGMKKHELIPANTGISDMGLESQISAYNTECLKFNKLAATSGTANPVTIELDKSLTSMHNNINRSIDNFLRTLQIKLQQAKAQEAQSNRLISSVPTQEKEINNVLRQQKIKEELYLYLLNKREENALQLAITEPTAKIIENAGGDDNPVFPSSMNIILIGFVLGLALPAGVIYAIFWYYSLDTKIHNRKDVEAITNIPIVGELPCKKKDQEDQEIIATETGKDRISEALRIIRGNLEYMLPKREDGLGSVIQMTSTVPHEGKSYVSINLALSCAHTGKKVVAIDLDLRKGNFSKYLGGRKKNIGISAYLSGKIDDMHEIINHGAIHQNLDTVSVGAMPPNPSDLLMSERFDLLIENLRKEYDLIFLDTVPYTVVADAAIVNRVVDMTVYVIRDNMIDKNYVYDLDKMYRDNKFHNLAVLLTDIRVDSKRYGYYGYGYGYGYGQGYGYGYVEGEAKKKRRFPFIK